MGGADLKMANYWLVKSEPSTYSYDDLEREKTAVWDGVKNPVALRNLRSMHAGDQVLVYHTGDQKAVVGWATVVSAPYPDPKKGDEKLVVIDLKAQRRFDAPLPLVRLGAFLRFLQQPVCLACSSLCPLPGRPGCFDCCCFEALGA